MSWGDAANSPFPFVVGCDRSGTTLLRAMLASHPDLAIPDESYFITGLIARRRRYERRGAFTVDAFLRDLSTDASFARWTISRENLAQAFHDTPPVDLADAVRRVFAVYAQERSKPRYGDKTPVYVMHMDVLARLLPEAVFIHIVRDGRDVALSLVDRSFALPRDVGQAALFWRDRVCAGMRFGAALGERYLQIRYEDLIADPAVVLASVCAHTGLPFDEAILAEMLSYPDNAGDLLKDAAHPSAHVNVRREVTAGLRDWREQMSAHDRLLLETIAGTTLRAAGYSLSTPPGAAAVSLRARRASAAVRWFARKCMLRSLIWVRRASGRLHRTVLRVAPASSRQHA